LDGITRRVCYFFVKIDLMQLFTGFSGLAHLTVRERLSPLPKRPPTIPRIMPFRPPADSIQSFLPQGPCSKPVLPSPSTCPTSKIIQSAVYISKFPAFYRAVSPKAPSHGLSFSVLDQVHQQEEMQDSPYGKACTQLPGWK